MTTTLSIIAVVISAVALAASWWLGVRSARAAESSAAEARKVAQLELDRDHEAYRPPQPHNPRFEMSTNPRTGDHNLSFVFTPSRSYRILGESLEGGSRSPLSMNGMVHPAGQEVRVFVQTIRPVRETASVEKLRLRFWPPAAVDEGVEHWTCRCGRPTASDGPAHWEWLVTVETPEDPDYDIMETIG
ncbi:hypothetical protein [Micromonospora sp. URMC 103]|uniref:hypothetical protein n=1 Tax=Micromonospora sp. URMC 103 TaxID=3423406 RepID=UPI003F1AF1A4